MEDTKFYIRKFNDLEELSINKLLSKDYFYYYNIFIAIKVEFIKVKQVLPKYIVFDETLISRQLTVYIYRDDLIQEDIISYSSNYQSILEGLKEAATANERDDFSIKFYLL